MDLIMHRVTKESGLTDSANGSMAKDTEPLGSTTKGGRHVGLDKMCLLMEVHLIRVSRKFARFRGSCPVLDKEDDQDRPKPDNPQANHERRDVASSEAIERCQCESAQHCEYGDADQ